MNLVIKGKNLEVTPSLRDYVESKLGRINKYSSHVIEAEVELSVVKNPSVVNKQTVEVTVSANGAILRSQEAAADMYAAIDLVKDKIERQVKKYEERRMHSRRSGKLKTGLAMAQSLEIAEAAAEEAEVVVEAPPARLLKKAPAKTGITRRNSSSDAQASCRYAARNVTSRSRAAW
jgi:ribosomal subunit interface protein